MNLPPQNKLILLDWNVFVFQSVHAWRSMCQKGVLYVPHPAYLITQSIITCLGLIGIQNDDLICVISDSGKSWRKSKDSSYKSERRAQREALESEKWWENKFQIANELKVALNQTTPWIFLEQPTFEADDIIATAPKIFPNNKIIIVSTDSDLHQLADYSNVLVFSPKAKSYKHIVNPLGMIEKKIHCEKTDGLVKKIDISNKTTEEYLLRKSLVDLVHLPHEIEHIATAIWQIVDYKLDYNWGLFPYPNLAERLVRAYHESKFPIVEEKVKKKRKRKEKQIILDLGEKLLYNSNMGSVKTTKKRRSKNEEMVTEGS